MDGPPTHSLDLAGNCDNYCELNRHGLREIAW